MAVVLGYDASPGAARALQVAIEMARAFGETLVLVHGAAAPGITGEEYATHQQAIRQAARAALDHARAAAQEAGLEVLTEIPDERPAQALLNAASQHSARLIVVGSWSEHPLRGALLGSTPHKLLHLSTTPVVCVPLA